MERRAFVQRITAALATLGAVGVLPSFDKAGDLSAKDVLVVTPKPAVKCLMPPGHIPTAEDFFHVLQTGQEEFMIKWQLPNGKILSEEAPFDQDDPMSYVLIQLIIPNPMLRIYCIGKGKADDRIIPYLHRA